MNNQIELHHVSLEVPIFDVNRGFRSSMVNCLGGKISKNKKNKIKVDALRDISFTIQRGDRLGLVGHNGAGKTTLLRLLARIYRPTHGHYICRGKVIPLLSMDVGVEADDTGIENIRTMCMLFGMSKQEIAKKEQDIIEFSELGDFIHLPVRSYSSGMMTRLSFSVMTSLESDIILMDEHISTGDAGFVKKAKQRIDDFYQKMHTLVLASHSNDLIRKVCDKALWLEHGEIKAFGDVHEVLEMYEGL